MVILFTGMACKQQKWEVVKSLLKTSKTVPTVPNLGYNTNIRIKIKILYH
jgi:hypothetical protein